MRQTYSTTETWPDCQIFAGILILIPTAAAACLPDGSRQTPIKAGHEIFQTSFAQAQCALTASAQQFEAPDDVLHLRFYHDHHGIVPQAGVRAEQQEIGETRGGDAQEGTRPAFPKLAQLDATAPDHSHTLHCFRNFKTGIENEHINGPFAAVDGHDAMPVHASDRSGHQFDVWLTQRRVEVA